MYLTNEECLAEQLRRLSTDIRNAAYRIRTGDARLSSGLSGEIDKSLARMSGEVDALAARARLEAGITRTQFAEEEARMLLGLLEIGALTRDRHYRLAELCNPYTQNSLGLSEKTCEQLRCGSVIESILANTDYTMYIGGVFTD